jgi:hypothetical protein
MSTYYVSPDGNDANNGLGPDAATPATALASIRQSARRGGTFERPESDQVEAT